jgi:hypothetical protein
VRVRQLELLVGEGVPVRNGRVDLAAVGWPDRDTDVVPGDDAGSVRIDRRDDAERGSRTIG